MKDQTDWIEISLLPPAEAPEAWLMQTYRCGARELRIARPRDPDRLLDDPAVQHASQTCDYMPYWAYLWPGAVLLAQYVSAQPQQAWRAIEIGCGLGLAGLAALAAGMHVTFNDYSPAALALAAHNARLNHFDRFDTRLFDWQYPPQDCFELVLGADVLYEPRCLDDVIRVLDSVLSPNGEAWLSDPDRSVADQFPQRARDQGFNVELMQVQAGAESGPLVSGRIFRVRQGVRSLSVRLPIPELEVSAAPPQSSGIRRPDDRAIARC